MFAIIEAGGTKTEIRYLSNSTEKVEVGAGINPYIHSDIEITQRLEAIAKNIDPTSLNWKRIFYYGAGCSHPLQIQRVLFPLAKIFPQADIEIESDLLGAARALCGHLPGFAVILGTGSNACLYNGATIQKGMTSFGFWLGDEGSGGHIGKMVFRSWLKNKLPEFESEIEVRFGSPVSQALESLYQDPSPNSRVASLAEIAIKNAEHPIFQEIITTSIRSFFEENQELWHENSELPWHFTGSVAWNLRSFLTAYLEANQKKVGTFQQGPSERLFQFHLHS